MRKLLLPAIALGLCTSLSAQFTQTLPKGYLTTNGNTANSWPWNNRSTTGHRCMWIYDSSHFKSPGPILINRLRWRTYSSYTTWAGGTHPKVTVNLSTCPVDYKVVSATFASNHGKDIKAVFNGTVTVTPSTHKNGRWYVEINFKVPFLYDPSKGDLVIDIVRAGGTVGSFVALDHLRDSTTTWTTKANRVQSYNSGSATTGLVGPYTAITEIQYVPAKGLYSAFSATPVEGKSPLKVQFKDETYTSSAGGVKTWAWDLNGDNKVDSTAQNPFYVYAATGWDKKFDVTLTTTDGVNPKSTVTRKGFITVNPFPVGTATNYGAGSTNKPIPAPVQLSKYSYTYAASATRGYYFQAPGTMVITGFEVPNEKKQPYHAVWCFTFPKKPTTSYSVTAADTKFFTTKVAVNTIMKPKVPIVIQKGTWVGVLGACHASTGTTMQNSYGNGPVKTTIGGMPTTLTRLYHQSSLVGGNGTGLVYPSSGSIARVFMHVAGNVIVPSLDTIGQPAFGLTPKLDLKAGFSGAQGGVLLMSATRLPTPVPTPFGNLLIAPPFQLSLFVPTGTGQIPLTIPNDRTLADVKLQWQGAVFDLTKGLFGLSNGTQWLLGQK